MEQEKDEKGLVSIIVPLYNVENFIETTISCVQAQTYLNWELLLVNDCSTDKTVEKVLPFLQDTRIHLIEQQENGGAAKARNRGLQEAKGNYIAFLDGDDIWKADKVKKELSFLKEKQAGFVCTSYEFASEAGIGNGKIAHVPATLTYKEALKNTIIFTSTVLFDLEKVSREKIFMPQVPSEDTATWWKILKSGTVAYGLDEALVLYRRPDKSLSSNKWVAIKRIWNLYRHVEELSFFYSVYNFLFYAVRTVKRRL